MAPKAPKAKAEPKAKGTQRMLSFTSFQPGLSLSSSSSRQPMPRTKSGDLMPPPPVPSWSGGSNRSGSSSSSSSKVQSKRNSTSKRAGKAPASDEDDDVIAISSDEDERPVKKRGRSRQLNHEMWTDVYGPSSSEELAPGKLRRDRLRDWLSEALYGVPYAASQAGHVPPAPTRDRVRKYRRVALVSGPAGIGKTTTVRVLAQEIEVELVEWTEGAEERGLGAGFEHESSIAKLSAFLARHAYPPLALGAGPSKRTQRPRVLLLTGLPNLAHLPTREAFHDALAGFCRTYTDASAPLVIVHSDSGAGGRAEESWMDRERGSRDGPAEILGPEVNNSAWSTQIDFLALAPTFMTKALNRVLELAIDDPASRPPSGAVQLIALSSNGDLRSAINSLQVLCSGDALRVKGGTAKKQRTAPARGRGSRGGRGARVVVSDEIRAALDAVTRREQSLNLFHALGRVLYNKRLDDPATDADNQEAIDAVRKLPPADPLPAHLHEFSRRRSMVQMEEFIPTVPVDASTLALWIHHNIPQYCDDIEQLGAILDDFGAADVMRTDDDIWQSSPQAIAYALHLTVRGSLMGLPSPVGRHGQKTVKPQFFESFRLEKANAALLGTATEHMSRQAVAISTAVADGERADGPPWGGLSSKTILAAEVVPMALKIQRLSQTSLLPPSVASLELNPHSGDFTGGAELGATDLADEDDFDADAAGADGMGVPDVSRWENDDSGGQDSSNSKAAPVGWLEDDDIEAWDSD